jgi:hypothetical protein
MQSSERKTAKNLQKLAPPSPKRQKELDEIQRQAIARFRGQLTTLESALGMLQMGDHLGWRVLAIVHSPRTLKKYEEILGIKVKEFFPEEGPSADRNAGYLAARKLSNFWKAVTGETKIEDKQKFE